MIGRIVFGILLCSYLAVIVPFSTSLANRPVVVKLGTLPEAELLKVVTGDQRYLVAQCAVLKVLFYYGTLVERFKGNVLVKAEYNNMFTMLQTSSRLDPWNADVYYFTQAAFTWEQGRVAEVNEMLKNGMKYRNWDYQLPFFLGFNSAYFLKDYQTAALYYKKAAELSGNPLFANLSARYFYEAGQDELGLRFIEYMQRRITDRKLLAMYELRKKALVATITLKKGVAEYTRRFGKTPARLSDLVTSGILTRIPDDPYQGTFYLDEKGQVRSTSKFAAPAPAVQPQPKQPVPQEMTR